MSNIILKMSNIVLKMKSELWMFYASADAQISQLGL